MSRTKMVLGLAAVMVAMLMAFAAPTLAQVVFEEAPDYMTPQEAALWNYYWYGIEPFDARIEPFDDQRYGECQYMSPDVIGYEEKCL
jgi:hypothetical protein